MRLTLAKRILATDPHQIVRRIAEQDPRRLAGAFGVAGFDGVHDRAVLLGGHATRRRPAAFRRRAGVRHGHRPVRPAARPRPLRRYLGLLFLCLLVIAFVPSISTWLPHAMGYGK